MPIPLVLLLLTSLSRSLTTSRDGNDGVYKPHAAQELAKRNAQADGVCTVIYNCPTSGADALVFIFTGELTSNQNGGGTLRAAAEQGQGVLVTPPTNKDISVFPASIGEDWFVQRCKRIAGVSALCLVTWSFSLVAQMDNPNSLVYQDLRTAAVSEICVRPEDDQCASPTRRDAVRCQVRPGTGCN